VVHWLLALAFFNLLVTGLVVGRRGTFHDVMYVWHIASAGALLGGVALVTAVGSRHGLLGSTREPGSLDTEDREWLRAVPAWLLDGAPEPLPACFHAGQKVNSWSTHSVRPAVT
jgi:cytochrome b subunit of formate dehydrogenase